MSVVHRNISNTDQSPLDAESLRWSNTVLVYATRRTIPLLVSPLPTVTSSERHQFGLYPYTVLFQWRF